MNLTAKKKQKLQKQLGALSSAMGRGSCWVCGSIQGMKAGREGYKLRCTRCERAGKTNDAVVEYQRLQSLLGSPGRQKSAADAGRSNGR